MFLFSDFRAFLTAQRRHSALVRAGILQEFYPENPTLDSTASPKSNAIFIACMPKSGSTYLANALREHLGLESGHFVAQYGHFEQNICESRISFYSRQACVVQQHCPGNHLNTFFLCKYGVTKPIVLFRRLDDAIFSLSDHFSRESIIAPPVVVPSNFLSWHLDDRLMFIIMNIVPWYLSFYDSWLRVSRAEIGIKPIFLRYEQVYCDFEKTLTTLLGELGRASAMSGSFVPSPSANTRFNKGVVGRGGALSQVQREALRRLIASWENSLESIASPFEGLSHREVLGFDPL